MTKNDKTDVANDPGGKKETDHSNAYEKRSSLLLQITQEFNCLTFQLLGTSNVANNPERQHFAFVIMAEKCDSLVLLMTQKDSSLSLL